jgi:nucleoside 2-deoxyribosyltransferase
VKRVYVIGSLRNPAIPLVAFNLRAQGLEVFDDWYAAGPKADDHWKSYEQGRGRNFIQALQGRAATNVFRFDKANLDRCDAAVLVLPAGKSGHMELGYFLGCGKPGYILLDSDADRWDVMYKFATGVYWDAAVIAEKIKADA